MHALKTKINEGEKTITCPNPSCGATFESPLKAFNLKDSTESYACPCCLATLPQDPAEPQEEPEQPEPEQPEQEEPAATEPIVETDPPQENQIVDTPKGLECPHYLGYLSEKERKQNIPDECMVCKNLVECMLQKVRA